MGWSSMVLSDHERAALQSTYRLSDKQLRLLELMMEGHSSNKELSERTDTTLAMVRLELHYMYQSMGVGSKTDAVSLAFRTLRSPIQA